MPARGDAVWLEFGKGFGHEQGGRRPVLVVSPRAYNDRVGLALVCPMTSRVKGYPFEVALSSDLAVSGVVLADQVKSLDWRARRAKHLARVPDDVVRLALVRIATLVG